jgi:hypothetical protein
MYNLNVLPHDSIRKERNAWQFVQNRTLWYSFAQTEQKLKQSRSSNRAEAQTEQKRQIEKFPVLFPVSREFDVGI